jgi:MinD-like ATPase involved in chromosome partitioning or flagellar assembly
VSVLSLVSAHGSPGVTTAALALAATWPQHRKCLVVEADVFGGVIAARYGLGDTPGAVSLTAAARRHGLDDDLVWEHVQQLPGGLPVLVGPPSPDESHAVFRDLAGELAGWATAQRAVDVIVDGGRLMSRSSSIAPLLKAGTVMVVARPTVDQLRPAAIRLEAMKASGSEASILLVGDQPHGPAEVASSLHCRVAGVVAWDPKTAAILAGTPGAMRDLRRSPLIRSAATLAVGMATPRDGDPPGSPEETSRLAQSTVVGEARS